MPDKSSFAAIFVAQGRRMPADEFRRRLISRQWRYHAAAPRLWLIVLRYRDEVMRDHYLVPVVLLGKRHAVSNIVPAIDLHIAASLIEFVDGKQFASPSMIGDEIDIVKIQNRLPEHFSLFASLQQRRHEP